tara:strand:- start:3732 stop:4778 length:1047 start_codon:yes stop_codon:yes gene_type:complete
MTIVVTGGAGFIGSNFIHYILSNFNTKVINLDALTYAGNLENLNTISKHENYIFKNGSINDHDFVKSIFNDYSVKSVINFAAESHVDRSIHGPAEFISTNIVGTFNLLEVSLEYWRSCKFNDFRFIHVSTDEVYGSLDADAVAFTEKHAFRPNSPYAASKASSDHLVRSYNKTYNFPAIITNCSNNYGPYQFPEKLIPLIILNSLNSKPLPIYGDGSQIRDWLYVKDHCIAIHKVLMEGSLGETYNIGGLNEKTNLEVVHIVCSHLNKLKPRKTGYYQDLIKFVKDRPGHDTRYAIDATKITNELGWTPAESFETGILKTINWYLENFDWVENVTSGDYKKWIDTNYS